MNSRLEIKQKWRGRAFFLLILRCVSVMKNTELEMQGTRLLIESLLFPLSSDNGRMVEIQKDLNSECGKNILELGAGVGVVGTTLAAATTCKVLLTDL